MNLMIKGFIIGVGKIIPGVSGAMLAITLGEYEQIIKSISNITKNPQENIKYLSKIGIGIILAITLTSKIIVKSLNKYYFPTMLLFIGMILGGITKTLKKITIRKKDIIISIIILIIINTIIKNINTTNTYQIHQTIIDFIKLIGIGIVDALSSIIPGISGTALLMMIGYYDIILQTFATILCITNIRQNMFIMIPFTIGFTLGTMLISKIINKLIKNHKNILNITITIFMIITLLIILNKTIQTSPTIIELIIGITLAIIGITVTMILEKT